MSTVEQVVEAAAGLPAHEALLVARRLVEDVAARGVSRSLVCSLDLAVTALRAADNTLAELPPAPPLPDEEIGPLRKGVCRRCEGAGLEPRLGPDGRSYNEDRWLGLTDDDCGRCGGTGDEPQTERKERT